MSDFAWFWISGAIAICGIAFAIAYSNVNSPDTSAKEVEFAKVGLEECVKSKGNYSTLWTKDCVRYLQYIEEGKYTEPKTSENTNSGISF